MRTGRPSSTAEHNALFRALSAAETKAEPALDDPVARQFLRGPVALARPLLSVRGGRWFLRSVIDRRWPGVRASVVARTALIDHLLVENLAADRNQVLLLGAGFDTRPYRLERLAAARVFEVDHPATQRAKRVIVACALGGVPTNVAFVETDFEADDLDRQLTAAGFQHDERTVFVWEGVTNYLTAPAVDRTVRWLGECAPGSAVVFTYIDCDVFTHPEHYVGVDRLQSTLDRVGEQLRFAIEPLELTSYLATRGLALRTDVGAAEYRLRFFGSAARAMHGHEFYRVATADVTG